MVVDNAVELSIKIPEIFRQSLFPRVYCLTFNVQFNAAINGYGVSESWRASVDLEREVCSTCKKTPEDWDPRVRSGCGRHRWVKVFESVFEGYGKTMQEAIDNLADRVAKHRDKAGNISVIHGTGAELLKTA